MRDRLGPERAVLVGAELHDAPTTLSLERSLDELERLAETAGARVVARETQRLASINPATFIGSGKLHEVRLTARACDADLVIFDDELSPAQLRNIERELECKVLDRTALILDIFAMRARTREAALQIELAQYAYRLPRLTRQWTHLSRQAVGGVGLRGPGETQLELDRREIQRRMSQIRTELEAVRRQRRLRRRRRQRSGISVISIVGYTNAGKSTLLNRLAGSDVFAEDKLFATLDPTTRQVTLPNGKLALFTDTVGFIQKLPTELVMSFRATLEEVQEADLLLHVADASDPDLLQKVATVEDMLREIGAEDTPVLLALNKVDLVDPDWLEQRARGRFDVSRPALAQLEDRYGELVPISATQGLGIEALLDAVERVLVANMIEIDTLVPYAMGEVLNLWHENGLVSELEYQEDGIRVHGRLPRWLAARLGYVADELDEDAALGEGEFAWLLDDGDEE